MFFFMCLIAFAIALSSIPTNVTNMHIRSQKIEKEGGGGAIFFSLPAYGCLKHPPTKAATETY